MLKKSRKSSFTSVWSSNLNLSVSVIVPAYNEEKNIVRKIENLLQQGYPDMNILVVDDGSTDGTVIAALRFIEQNSLQHKVRLLNLPKREGKPSAINYGLQYCTGEIVVVSDADTILGERAIQKLIENFQDQNIGGVTGKLSMYNYNESFHSKLEENYRGLFDILRLGESFMDSTPIFNGALIAVRRNLFDPLKSDTIADDTEIALRIREKGYKSIYDPRVEVYASTPKQFKSRISQKIRRAQGIMQSFIRHRNILFNSNYGKFGLIIFPCEFFMFFISPLLFLLIALLLPLSLYLISLDIAHVLFALSITVFIGFMLVILERSLKRRLINPLKLLATFLEHQIFLTLALFSLVFKKGNVKWKKIEN